jgi:hypothetical protein
MFQKLKFYLKGRQFVTMENIENAATDQLKVFPLAASSMSTKYGNKVCGDVQPPKGTLLKETN